MEKPMMIPLGIKKMTTRTPAALKWMDFGRGFLAALLFAVEIIPVGATFGVAASAAGLTKPATIAMSGLVFAGASQFLAVTMLASGAPIWSIVTSTLAINLRHVLMATYVGNHLEQGPAWQRGLLGLGLTDESFALAIGLTKGGNSLSSSFLLGANCSIYLQWLTGTAAGVLLGDTFPGLVGLGLKAILYALFAGIITLSLSSWSDLLTVTVAALTAVTLNVVGAGRYAVLTASLVASLVGLGVEQWILTRGGSSLE
ncbi:MAG: AzlC family ABC transporter permease [Firmicutes bacterium]|nr:AzlC family ABC transporter permease [Bacillota bacterium]